MKKIILLTIAFSFSPLSILIAQITYSYPNTPYNVIYDGRLIAADYWDTVPKILSAGVGFSDIIGVDTTVLTQAKVKQAGGAWLSDVTCSSAPSVLTSTSLKSSVTNLFGVSHYFWG